MSNAPAGYAQRVRLLRLRLGLSQRELAERLHTSNVSVSRWEQGHTQPAPAFWHAIVQLEHGATPAAGSASTAIRPTVVSTAAAGPWQPEHLPSPLTSFIGRLRELAGLRVLLDEARLVTLAGPGGCGKTRLALEAARQLAPAFADGVAYAELAAVHEPELLIQTVARALGISEQPGCPIRDALRERLRQRRLLLVLDNCEHLAVPVADLAGDLLESCPRLRILATSRETLRLSGEAILRVPPLSVPSAAGTASVEEIAASEAAGLFVARVRSRLPAFSLTAAVAGPVRTICRRLDGLPLALELAAARVPLLSLPEIAARLDERFVLLTGGARTAPARHRTLQAAIDSSYVMLTTEQQALFRRLSVFAGSFSLAAVEAICADLQPRPLDALDAAVERSLVNPVTGSERETRYQLLETLRAYAADRLVEAGEAEVARTRHAGYYLGFAEARAKEIDSADQASALQGLAAEQDNIRAALHWFAGQGDGDGYLRLAASNHSYWLRGGALSEGRRWLSVEATLRQGASISARAYGAFAAAALAREAGELQDAELQAGASLGLYQELGDQRRAGTALNLLGMIAGDRRDTAAQLDCYRQSAKLLLGLGLREQATWPLINLGGAMLNQREFTVAHEILQEALAICREAGVPRNKACCLCILGCLLVFQNQVAAGRACYEEALALCRAIGDVTWTAIALGGLGIAAACRREHAAAQRHLAAALGLLSTDSQIPLVLDHLELVLYAAVMAGAWERAALLLGAAGELRRVAGLQRNALFDLEYEAAGSMTAQQLDPAVGATLRARGACWSVTEAADYARSGADLPDEQSARSEHGTAGRPALTRREREVLQLLASGASNREIAGSLAISLRTVEHHVTSVYAKLGLENRRMASLLPLVSAS